MGYLNNNIAQHVRLLLCLSGHACLVSPSPNDEYIAAGFFSKTCVYLSKIKKLEMDFMLNGAFTKLPSYPFESYFPTKYGF